MKKPVPIAPPAASGHPRSTIGLTGHDEAEHTLLEAWNAGRLPHAWLIGGLRGVGKATLAYRFARFVLDAGSPATGSLFGAAAPPAGLDIDTGSPLFHRIAAGGHADLLTVELTVNEKTGRQRSEIPAEDVRRIVDFFRLTAAEGGYRVCIVDAVDEMNRYGANALLKILEEPPPRSLLLLVSHAPEGLLPTIRSRCRRLTLKPLGEAALTSIVAERLPDLPPAERQALVGLAEGSPGRALSLAASGGVQLYHDLIQLLARLPDLDVGQMHAFGEHLARRENAAAYQVWTDLFAWWLARLARSAAGAGSPAEIVAGEGALLQRLGRGRNLDRWAEVWEKVARLFERADSVSLDRKQIVLNALFAVGRAARG
ncbi:MAG TPA: DNA polymerase III subunit delta' [Candidatus Sulfotelmatobacter sp.]|nr:DNA polymerase III subunit delta' [Candidatus Sulfotelmatobacter sp.]